MEKNEDGFVEDPEKLNAKFLEILGKEREEGGEFDLDTQVASAVLEYLDQKGIEEIENLAVLQFSEKEVEGREKVYEDDLMIVTADSVDDEKYFGVWMKV